MSPVSKHQVEILRKSSGVDLGSLHAQAHRTGREGEREGGGREGRRKEPDKIPCWSNLLIPISMSHNERMGPMKGSVGNTQSPKYKVSCYLLFVFLLLLLPVLFHLLSLLELLAFLSLIRK